MYNSTYKLKHGKFNYQSDTTINKNFLLKKFVPRLNCFDKNVKTDEKKYFMVLNTRLINFTSEALNDN